MRHLRIGLSWSLVPFLVGFLILSAISCFGVLMLAAAIDDLLSNGRRDVEIKGYEEM
ncbi:MAG: hypothetical protein M1343_08265 [Chloroflexi bacterium]|nr:hypothetical protein [Chloroflexota bacterium]